MPLKDHGLLAPRRINKRSQFSLRESLSTSEEQKHHGDDTFQVMGSNFERLILAVSLLSLDTTSL